MIIVRVIGGLGNQMFQYSFAKLLETKGMNVKLDISGFTKYNLHGGYHLDKYYIDLETANVNELNNYNVNGMISKLKNKMRIQNKNVLRETNLLFDEKLLSPDNDSYIEGYFQSEKYFYDIKKILLKQFKIKTELSDYSKDLENIIKKYDSTCSIHIRRGDYLNKKNISIHGICSSDYYEKSINYMNNKCEKVNYIIFTDDPVWAKDNFKVKNAIYVMNETNRIPHEDMYLMSLCTNNIIANSSFSWWGAWLNKSQNKIVITPEKWFADENYNDQSIDIVPTDWMKI